MSHSTSSDYSYISDDPEQWTPMEYLLFTSPFGLGHVASKVLLDQWMFDSYAKNPKLWILMQAAQTAAYTGVGWAIAGPAMTPAHLRHVVVGSAIKRFTRPPVGSVAGPMLIWPNVLSVQKFFSARSPQRVA